MAYSLKKGDQSNYEVVITFTEENKKKEKMHVLQHFQQTLNVSGFRKGHVPLDIVEKQVSPESLDMEIEEHIINHEIQNIIKENETIKFIGEPYGYKKDQKDDTITITLNIDVFPELTIDGEKWKKEKVEKIEVKVEPEEIENAFLNLKRNYADYQETDILEKDTVSKIGMEFLDKEGNVQEKGSVYVGNEEFTEDKFWKDTFEGKKKDETIEVKYNEKKLPKTVLAKEGKEIEKIRFTIKDIKKQIFPEFNKENIEKFFGKDAGVSNEEDIRQHIEKTIREEKYYQQLAQNTEKYIQAIQGKGVSIVVPETVINQEFKSRLESLEKRMGSKEKVKEYINSLSEEDAKNFINEIRKAAKDSLEKYFILTEITRQLGIEIDWGKDEDFGIEKKLYAYFNGESSEETSNKKSSKKKTEEDNNEDEEKAPKKARKTTKKED